MSLPDAPTRELVDPSGLLHALSPTGGLLTGVPCSLLGPVFDAGRLQADHRYVPATNEGEAVAIAAGFVAAGGEATVAMQNSGLGHALDPLLSLVLPSEIPVAMVVSHRGHPAHESLAHHARMGRITYPLLALAGIAAVDLGEASVGEIADLWRERRAAGDCMAVVVPPEVLGACRTTGPFGDEITRRAGPERAAGRRSEQVVGTTAARDTRAAVIDAVLGRVEPEAVVIGTTGHTARQLFATADRDRNVYVSGSMGHANAFGLGVGLRRPDLEVFVLDGDGAALMHLGNLATIGAFGGPRYRHVVLDNGVHATTGGQPTVSRALAFVEMALALGYASAASSLEFTTPDEAVAWLCQAPGPAMLHAPIVVGVQGTLPRVGVHPADQARRFARALAPAGVAASVDGRQADA